MLTLLTKQGSVTLVTTVGYIVFDVVDVVGKGSMQVRSVSCRIASRPDPDPRRVVIWIGQRGSTTGTDSSDGVIANGFASASQFLTRLMPDDFNLNITEMIGFGFEGEIGDVCEARVLYSEVD